MEFQEFCKEKERMCKFWRERSEREYCYGCGINQIRIEQDMEVFTGCNDVCLSFPTETEQIVEQWAEEHPIVRNCDKLHEVFGNGFKIMMHNTFNVFISCNGKEIPMSEWMHQEYKEPKEDDNGND